LGWFVEKLHLDKDWVTEDKTLIEQGTLVTTGLERYILLYIIILLFILLLLLFFFLVWLMLLRFGFIVLNKLLNFSLIN